MKAWRVDKRVNKRNAGLLLAALLVLGAVAYFGFGRRPAPGAPENAQSAAAAAKTQSSVSAATPQAAAKLSPASTPAPAPATPAPAPLATDSMVLSPPSGTVKPGSRLTVTLRENSGNEVVNAVQTEINYDASRLQLMSVVPAATFSIDAGTDTKTPGIIRMVRGQPGPGVSGTQTVATIEFLVQPSALGSLALSLNPANSYLVRAADATNILRAANGAVFSVGS